MEPLITRNNLIDDAKCYRVVRILRWPDGQVICPLCESTQIDKHGHHNTEPERQRYFCNSCTTYFDDFSCTIFAGRHQPLQNWILCLNFMGLNLSNLQIAHELDLNEDDVQQMTTQLLRVLTIKNHVQNWKVVSKVMKYTLLQVTKAIQKL